MHRIDAHCHAVPEVWRKWCMQTGWDKPDGMPEIPPWSPEMQIEHMNNTDVQKAVLSITSPGTHLKMAEHELAVTLTRECNTELSQICAKYPERLAFFASLPIPEIEASIEEIDYALDHLGAVGFALITNTYGIYLGDSALDAVFEKLNERHAIVFMHPGQCHSHDHPEGNKPLPQYPTPMLEFFFDTTRAVTNLILSGTVEKFPNITFIVSHCGATIPPVVERFSNFASKILHIPGSLSSAKVKDLFKTRFYFDLAGFPFPDQIHGCLRMTDTSRLLYGSDYPYTPANAVAMLGEIMDDGLNELFDAKTVHDIYHENAKKLFKFGRI